MVVITLFLTFKAIQYMLFC